MNKPQIYSYKTLRNVATRLCDDLNTSKVVLLYAFNRTGKTRLSMAFKDWNKKKYSVNTLYFNAFTEDLFTWNNDLEKDKERYLMINSESKFVSGLKGLSIEERIHTHLDRFAQIDFKIDYEEWKVIFNREIPNPKYNPKNPNNVEPEKITEEYIKISRGEENIFIFSLFMAICEIALEGHEEYKWVKNIYIDDPISSLDENNAVIVASDLSKMIKEYLDNVQDGSENIKFVISSHHSLFFNVMYNELRKTKGQSYFLHKTANENYKLQATKDTPFFHHIEQLCEINEAVKKYQREEAPKGNLLQSNILKTYHFNMLRAILEKTSIFFGKEDFSFSLNGIKDEELFSRALNIMSHGRYSLFAPQGMMRENADLFVQIFDAYTKKYEFELPDIFFD